MAGRTAGKTVRGLLGCASGLALTVACLAGPAQADPRGRIAFLGWTTDRLHSIWLSAVEPGDFFIVFPESGAVRDTWTQSKTGLRLTVSPDVREYGGTHNLFTHITQEFASFDNFVDSDDQRPGRFNFPNTLTPPTRPTNPTEPAPMPTLPQGIKPPVGKAPPGGAAPAPPAGVTPALPGGVQAPVATLPPAGLTPGAPSGISPPIGVAPPVAGATPTLPQGVRPPAAKLPPAGITPGLPGGVQAPVGTLPASPPTGLTPGAPSGISPPIGVAPPVVGATPTLPQGVRPPAATLPPAGLTPGAPSGISPPIGVAPPVVGATPTLPQGVRPPTAMLPPAGITPGLPGGVQAPIGNLPVSPSPGLTPGRPSIGALRPGGAAQAPVGILPPGGVTPSLPSGVAPPVATLPPAGLTPTPPQGVQPPVGVVPPGGPPQGPPGVRPPLGRVPPGGLTPAAPGGVQPPVAILPPQPDRPSAILPPGALAPGLEPVSPQERFGTPAASSAAGSLTVEDALARSEFCRDAEARAAQSLGAAPVPAECLGHATATPPPAPPPAPPWNAWFDAQSYDITDHRYGLDLKGATDTFTLGVDRRLAHGATVGVNFSVQNAKVDSFDGLMRLKTTGYSIGPYAAYPLSRRWMIDASLTYGWSNNDQHLIVLDGAFDSQTITGSLGLTGQYNWGRTSLQPRLALVYSHTHNDGYALRGQVAGFDLNVDEKDSASDSGELQVSTEINRVFLVGRTPVMPYAQAEIDYAFQRPNDGEVLTGDLTHARPSALEGALRAGVRAMLSPATILTLAGGRSGIGQNGLAIWELRFYLSHGF